MSYVIVHRKIINKANTVMSVDVYVQAILPPQVSSGYLSPLYVIKNIRLSTSNDIFQTDGGNLRAHSRECMRLWIFSSYIKYR